MVRRSSPETVGWYRLLLTYIGLAAIGLAG